MEETEATWWEKLLKLDPALVRGFIVTVVGLIGAVLKVTVLEGTVDDIVTFVLALLGILAGILIRPSVTPNAKVVVRDATPLNEVPTLQAGAAVVAPEDKDTVAELATMGNAA
jgi:hypothetical protein